MGPVVLHADSVAQFRGFFPIEKVLNIMVIISLPASSNGLKISEQGLLLYYKTLVGNK